MRRAAGPVDSRLPVGGAAKARVPGGLAAADDATPLGQGGHLSDGRAERKVAPRTGAAVAF